MKKIYLNELNNLDQNNFDEISEFLKEDENGELYFVDEGHAEWWQDLFNALQTIEDKKEEIMNFGYDGTMDDYGHQLMLAKAKVQKLEDYLNSHYGELEDYIRFADEIDDIVENLEA